MSDSASHFEKMVDPYEAGRRLHLSPENLVDELRAERDGALDWAARSNKQRLDAETALATERAAHAETRRLLDKAHNEGRSWMEYADELKDTVMAAEATIATQAEELTRYREALERISVGSPLHPHKDHDPVALALCPVAYCIAKAALETP